MDLFRLTATARRTVMAAMLWSVVALSVLANADTVPVSAAIRGELLVTPAHSRDDDLITVTVIDPDVETTVLNEAEATDFTGNTYVLPPGAAGEQAIFRVKNAPLTDLDGDGALNTSDVTTTVSTAAIAWVAPETGTFALVRGATNAAPITFTTTYRHSLVDTVRVKVTSPSDIGGFNLTLEETGPKTREFTATFKTGAASSTTNADNPGGATRPVIKVTDGQLVNLEYADQSPLTLVTNSVHVDTTLPLVTILAPLDGTATRNVTEYAKVRVTDEGSGIDIADVKFHLDLDRDGVFDEPGETVAASPSLSVPINKGWEAIVLLPPVNTDGPVKWHVTVTDRAGNVARSDANASATGQQDHTFTVDTVPPRPVAAYLGSSYDEDDEEILTNQQKRLRVVFSEKLDPGSVDPKRFVIGAGNVASSGYVHEDHPDTVWLTYESLSSVVTTLTVLPGAVKDAPGFPSEMSFLDPEDQLGPIVRIETDRAVTNGPIRVDVTSEEALASPPSLTINGVTYSKMVEITPKRWTLDVDATTLTGAASGQGVKNLQIAGLDAAGNAARGGQSPEAATYPANAVLFEFDSVIKPPAIVPGQGDVATSTSPVVVVTYADEMGEYAGDTHSSVTIVSAKLDGFDVTALMTATTTTSWTYQPAELSQGEHEFSVQARDDAGNIHGAIVVRFSVDAPPPTPTPTVEPTSTPTPVVVEDPGEEPPRNLQPETTATPVPEQSPTAGPAPQATPEVAPTATPVAEGAETPEPTATPAGITEADIQATVTALRSEEAEAGEKPADENPHIAAEAGYTVFGCGLPTGNTAGAVGDYAFIGIGLLGLVAMRQRRRLLRRGDASPGGEGDLMPDDCEV